MVGSNLKISLETVQTVIMWDQEKLITVKVTPSLWNRTSGLCGTLDSNIDNDFTSKTGYILKLPTTFIDSWRAASLDRDTGCLMERPAEMVEAICAPHIKVQAAQVCKKLLNNPSFGNCAKMFDLDSLIALCIADYCNCWDPTNPEKCACTGFSVVARDCIFQGILMDHGWRDLQICREYCEIHFSFLKIFLTHSQYCIELPLKLT